MTFVDNFISITDIRKNASFYINNIDKNGEKIIFVNNKPRAALIDIHLYEKFLNQKDAFLAESLVGSNEVIGTKEHNDLLFLMKNA